MSERIAQLSQLLNYMNHSYDRTQNFEAIARPNPVAKTLYRGFHFQKHTVFPSQETVDWETARIAKYDERITAARAHSSVLENLRISESMKADMRREHRVHIQFLEEQKAIHEARREKATRVQINYIPERAHLHIQRLLGTGLDNVPTVTSTTDSLLVAIGFALIGMKPERTERGELSRQSVVFFIQVPAGFPVVDTAVVLADFRRAERMRFKHESETLLLPYYGGKQLRFRLVSVARSAEDENFKSIASEALVSIAYGEGRAPETATEEDRARATNFTLITVVPEYVDIVEAPEEPDEVQGARMVGREEPAPQSWCTIA